MPWYKAGTVSVTLNSNAVTGSGTAFIVNCRVGDAFRGPDGGWYEIINVASDTALAIDPPYQGASEATGAYALAPMQGYVKDSADQLRAIVNTYGAKLAALGTTGNYDLLPVVKGGTGGATPADARSGLELGDVATDDVVPIERGGTGGTTLAGARAGLGLGAVATDNVVPVARGGTGGTTQAAARNGLGLGTAAVANVVGSVSTGAILESGSNGNGYYVKLQDGTMECCHVHTLNSVLVSNILGGTWTFPMAFFNSTVYVTATPLQGSGSDAAPGFGERFHLALIPPSETSISVRSISGSTSWAAGNVVNVHIKATGRWKA